MKFKATAPLYYMSSKSRCFLICKIDGYVRGGELTHSLFFVIIFFIFPKYMLCLIHGERRFIF